MRLLIVGGGFVGVAIACHLLQALPPGSRLTLVNAGGPLGRGLAYGTRSPLHLLNVPAARMSWHAAVPDDFIAWLRAQGLAADGASFVPRRYYGDYLAARLAEHVAARPDIEWQQVPAQVEDLNPVPPGAWQAQLSGGHQILADQVILALGNFAPACPHRDLLQLPDACYVSDPWRPDSLSGLDRNAPVAIVGTGLTMLDLLLSLQEIGHRGPLLALSRRGLLPQPHRSNELPPPSWQPPPGWLTGGTLRGCLRDVRQAARALMDSGGDWRDIWVALRPRTPELWQRLGQREQAQFLRHLQALWDVHRHRAAPMALEPLHAAVSERRLQLVAGRICSVEAEPGGGAMLTWKSRGSQTRAHFLATRIFNCTGPSTRLDDDKSQLFAALRSAGRLSACPHGLGLQIDDHYRMLDAQGKPQQGLYYAGPMLRSRSWEATAVPELRQHAEALVDSLLGAAALR